mmetsp:Transcript_23310/g.62266  ORF Transcript_23310/g.62266 Transcript_23310/m.62266 type:complete len:214 (+) Transcript_23310:432-1073(+)
MQKKKDGGKHVPSQLLIVAVSLSCLTYFTFEEIVGSWDIMLFCMGVDEPDVKDDNNVNGAITLAFGLAGVVFDLVCLWSFYRSNKKTGSARQVNMFSALLHVGADFMRSVSTTFMSVLILSGAFDSTCLDAYTSMFVGVTIIAGALLGFYKWLRMLMSWCRGAPDGASLPAPTGSAAAPADGSCVEASAARTLGDGDEGTLPTGAQRSWARLD